MSSDQKKTRLYLDLREIIDPDHTALVVWDVQNLLVERAFNRETFLENTTTVIDAARKAGVPVIFSKILPLNRDYESPFRTFMMMRRFGIQDPEKLPLFLQPGTPESEIHEAVAPNENEIVLDKHTPSLFIGTHFEAMMRNRGIDTLIFTGITTEIGIASSARDAVNRGFYTIVVEDAVSSASEELHYACLKILKSVCLVESYQTIVGNWT